MGKLMVVVLVMSGWSLAALPVELTEQWGTLRLVSTQTESRGHYLVFDYVDDTPDGVEVAWLECTLLDHRRSVVTSERIEVVMPTRETQQLKVLLHDVLERGVKAECRMAGGKHRRHVVP
jgi:hypothetical protein